METTIFKVLRNQHGPVGIVLAAKNPLTGKVGIGWSRCNVNAGEKFDKARGIKMATGRALMRGGVDPLPQSMHAEYATMVKRAVRYFKDCEFALGLEVVL
jgi:hypothetical protein